MARAPKSGSRVSRSTASATRRSTDGQGSSPPDAICAVVVHSDLERTGWFSCSDPLVERLHENALWSMRGNFLDVPTDCPQRDERLGGPGTSRCSRRRRPSSTTAAASFAPGSPTSPSSNASATGECPMSFRTSSRRYRRANGTTGTPPRRDGVTQQSSSPGSSTSVRAMPRCSQRSSRACAAGSTMSRGYAMRVVVWAEGFQFGDWLDPEAPPESANLGLTDPGLVATAYFAHSAELTAEAASVLGHTTAGRALPATRRRGACSVCRDLHQRRRPPDERFADRLRARAAVRPHPRRGAQRMAIGRRLAGARSRERLSNRNRIPRNAARLRRPLQCR